MTTTVDVRVVGANNLRAADANGKSDPYVVVFLQQRQGKPLKLHKTPTIKKTLSPRWDKGAALPDGWHDSKDLHEDDILIFEVFDKDVIGKDDELGCVKVRVGDIPTDRTESTFSLSGKHPKISGELILELRRTDDSAQRTQQAEDALALLTAQMEENERADSLLIACGMRFIDDVNEEEAIKLIVERGPKGDGTLDVKRTDLQGQSALHFAASRGASEKLIRLLVEEAGLDPNAHITGTGGYAPVHMAVMNNRLDVLRALKAVGADMNLRTSNKDRVYGGDTAAHIALQFEHLEALKVLKELGADLSCKDSQGETPREKIEEDRASKFGANKAEWLAVFDA
ncbi:phosphatidylserine decarboxylase [Balamuthia mandrillaris]